MSDIVFCWGMCWEEASDDVSEDVSIHFLCGDTVLVFNHPSSSAQQSNFQPHPDLPYHTTLPNASMLRHGFRWARPAGRWSSTVTLRWADGREAGAFLPKYLRENTMDAR